MSRTVSQIAPKSIGRRLECYVARDTVMGSVAHGDVCDEDGVYVLRIARWALPLTRCKDATDELKDFSKESSFSTIAMPRDLSGGATARFAVM